MLKQIVATVGIYVSLHIPDVTDIAYLTNISTTSTSEITHPSTYEHLRRHLPPEKEEKNKFSIQESFYVIYYNFEFKFSIRGT